MSLGLSRRFGAGAGAGNNPLDLDISEQSNSNEMFFVYCITNFSNV